MINDVCFSEVNSLFDKKLSLISSFQIYHANEEKRTEISAIPDEVMVKTVLDLYLISRGCRYLNQWPPRPRLFQPFQRLQV